MKNLEDAQYASLQIPIALHHGEGLKFHAMHSHFFIIGIPHSDFYSP